MNSSNTYEEFLETNPDIAMTIEQASREQLGKKYWQLLEELNENG